MENWKDIPGFEGRYQASDQGRVRSVDRIVVVTPRAGRLYERKFPGCVLAPGDCRGYLIVNLSGHGTVSVHLLVARTFLPGYEEGADVNHKDGNKTNNRLKNLEWLSRSENHRHAVRTGLRPQAIAVTNGVDQWPSQAEAALALVGDRRRGSEISRQLKGARASALGFVWSFA